MTYTRPPNVVRAGTALKQVPDSTTTSPPGVIPVELVAEIATTTSLGVVQVGSGLGITPSGVLYTTGSTGSTVNVTSISSNYTVLPSDYFIVSLAKSITVTLPAGTTGRVYIIKNRSTGNITVRSSGSNTIDGYTNISLGTESSLYVIFDTNTWNIIK